jgi:hypothetical protein
MDEKTETAKDASALTEAGQLVYLDAKKLRFHRHGDILRLLIENERTCLKCNIVRAFPLSQPDRFLSVRDGENKEIGLIADPQELDAENQRLVREELERRYLIHVIRRVIGIKERFGTVEWEVETQRGICKFTTRDLRENVVRPSPGRYILTDVDGNRFDVPRLSALDAQSQDWLLRHL